MPFLVKKKRANLYNCIFLTIYHGRRTPLHQDGGLGDLNPYQYGLYSNLIGMGGGRHVFFNFDFFITFETCYNKNLVAEWLGQSTFDLKDPGSNPVFGKFFFSVFLQMRFFQVSDKLQKW